MYGLSIPFQKMTAKKNSVAEFIKNNMQKERHRYYKR
jgi:hypothetical protein